MWNIISRMLKSFPIAEPDTFHFQFDLFPDKPY